MKTNTSLFKATLFLVVAIYVYFSVGSITGVMAQTPTPTVTPKQTENPTPSPSPTLTPTPNPQPSTAPGYKITDVYNLAFKDHKEKRRRAGIGDIIIVEVQNLKSLLRKAKCQDTNNTMLENCKEQDIALFLEGRKINKILPESGVPEIEGDKGTLQYHLQRNLDNDEAWADLLGAPLSSGNLYSRERTSVSVGLENEYPIEKGLEMNLTRVHWDPRLLGLLIPIAMLAWLFWLAPRTDLLRDIGEAPLEGQLNDKRKQAKKPFSLARCQMAFWFFLVIISFLFIWLITGAFDIITGSVLALIGISAGTALGGAAIDAGKNPVNQELQPQVSTGFFNDLLTDENGSFSFHRFQMFIWTIVLAFLFVSSVHSRLSMPEFSATLLALLGISAGTYLGFKLPEKQV